jgi:hypothetical protein
VSIEAVSWALNFADVRDPGEALVLIGIANHAGRDGRGCWASQATLAHYARCSDRTVRRKLSALEARGVIVRGDQGLVDHIAAPVRPVVWDLFWPGQNGRPVNSSGGAAGDGPDVAASGQSGHGSVLSGRSRLAGKPSTEPLTEPSLKDLAGSADFGTFWAAYPRHEKRAEAVKAWEKAVKRADPVDIVGGAVRYAGDPNRDPAFTAHASSWLNGDRWTDDPLPARGRQADRGAGILQAEFLAAQAADAAGVLGYVPGQLAIDGGPR